MMFTASPRVALLITCLIDLFRPRVAAAAVRLIERAGFGVAVPAQTCCGQVSFNGGDREGAVRQARQIIRAFSDYERVVVPSASCAAMVRQEYPGLFPPGSPQRAAAESLAARTSELTGFLRDVAGGPEVDAEFDALATYHDSCSALRGLGIFDQPRALLGMVRGLELTEMAAREECCGFGGLFCVRYAEISAQIADRKLDSIVRTGARALIGGDLGCLMHLEGRLRRMGHDIEALHIAEVLAGKAAGGADDQR
jgi:L-lactate dehydrogenase complex protein LldE